MSVLMPSCYNHSVQKVLGLWKGSFCRLLLEQAPVLGNPVALQHLCPLNKYSQLLGDKLYVQFSRSKLNSRLILKQSMYLSLNMTVLYSKLESRHPAASYICSRIRFSYLPKSVFRRSATLWQWVQVINGTVLLRSTACYIPWVYSADLHLSPHSSSFW